MTGGEVVGRIEVVIMMMMMQRIITVMKNQMIAMATLMRWIIIKM